MTTQQPATRPANPRFSSGPCAKPPTWTLDALQDAPLGRSHRAAVGKEKLKAAIETTRDVLGIPADYKIGIVPASDTGAVEMAMWSLLGERIEASEHIAEYGEIVDMGALDYDQDVVFTWNGTTSGVRMPNGDAIPANRAGLTICDATSAAFAQELPWDKLDVTTFSWQKVMGGEAAHGMLILSPRAVERLESYTPAWPMPKIFRLGGLDALKMRADANARAVWNFCATRDWIENLAVAKETRSNTSVCLKFTDPRITDGAAFAKAVAKRLEAEGIALDIGAYRDAPAGLRIWCGATVETSDIEAMLPWLDWAFHAEINA